jgi:hypothetical protein
MKWFLQFLSLGSAVLYTLLVIIDNRIPDSTVENTVVSEAQSKQRRLSVWDPYLPYRSFGQDRQASFTQPAHQQIESLATSHQDAPIQGVALRFSDAVADAAATASRVLTIFESRPM